MDTKAFIVAAFDLPSMDGAFTQRFGAYADSLASALKLGAEQLRLRDGVVILRKAGRTYEPAVACGAAESAIITQYAIAEIRLGLWAGLQQEPLGRTDAA